MIDNKQYPQTLNWCGCYAYIRQTPTQNVAVRAIFLLMTVNFINHYVLVVFCILQTMAFLQKSINKCNILATCWSTISNTMWAYEKHRFNNRR